MTARYHMSYLTSACWSQSRPGVFYVTKLDGTIDVWDLAFKQKQPVLTVKARHVYHYIIIIVITHQTHLISFFSCFPVDAPDDPGIII